LPRKKKNQIEKGKKVTGELTGKEKTRQRKSNAKAKEVKMKQMKNFFSFKHSKPRRRNEAPLRDARPTNKQHVSKS
jgi:hypothetical protein